MWAKKVEFDLIVKNSIPMLSNVGDTSAITRKLKNPIRLYHRVNCLCKENNFIMQNPCTIVLRPPMFYTEHRAAHVIASNNWKTAVNEN